MQAEHKGILYALGASIATSISAVFIKLLVDVPLETILFFRFLIAFLFIIPNLVKNKVQLSLSQTPKHFFRAIMGLTSICFYYYAVRNIPLVNAVTITNTAPLFTPFIIYFWLKMTIPKIRMIGLCIGFFGVILILQPEASTFTYEIASCVGLIGAMTSSFSQVGIKQLAKTESTSTIMAYYFLLAISFLTVPFIYTWTPIYDPMNWLFILLIGLFSTVFQFCLTKSLTHGSITQVGSIKYVGVILSGLFGWGIFGETPNYWVAAGALLIICGGFITILSKDTSKKRVHFKRNE